MTTPTNPFPTTIAAGVTWDSGPMAAWGYNKLSAAATLSQTGSLVIQRYIDPACNIALGDPITQAMTANTPATAWVNDGQPASGWRVTIQNTSVSTANLTNAKVLSQP